MENSKPTKEQKDQWHQNPDNWIWGILYYNKADKRLLPPKRTKWMGWTINFANRNSILFTLALATIIIVLGYAYERFLAAN
jgi:uncharacterized membrane protein